MNLLQLNNITKKIITNLGTIYQQGEKKIHYESDPRYFS
jgi:hypothetical protein